MVESTAEEIERLQREIGERQSRLYFLVLGDQRKSVSLQGICGLTVDPASCNHTGYSFEKIGRCCD